jgi:Tfp pilus assembly protein PilO
MDDVLKIIIAIVGLAGFPMLLYAGFVAIRLWERRMESKTGSPELLRELDELRARVAGLESVEARVQELEERVDFSERLLARDTTPQLRGER